VSADFVKALFGVMYIWRVG